MHKMLLLAVCACGLVSAADAPYAGTWKMNVAKSDFAGTTMTYERLSNGEMKATVDGQSYTFSLNGKDVLTPWGGTEAWKAVDASTWEVIEKTDGRVNRTSVLKLSADGKTLTGEMKSARADGSTAAFVVSFQRVSGGPGLAGKWETKRFSTDAPQTLVLKPKGSDGLMLQMVYQGAVCDAKFDGGNYPMTGAMWPAGWTCSIKKKGTHGLVVIWKKDGREMTRNTIEASADGMTLIDVSSSTGTDEKIKLVWERQVPQT